jgi:hypothetical protein
VKKDVRACVHCLCVLLLGSGHNTPSLLSRIQTHTIYNQRHDMQRNAYNKKKKTQRHLSINLLLPKTFHQNFLPFSLISGERCAYSIMVHTNKVSIYICNQHHFLYIFIDSFIHLWVDDDCTSVLLLSILIPIINKS